MQFRRGVSRLTESLPRMALRPDAHAERPDQLARSMHSHPDRRVGSNMPYDQASECIHTTLTQLLEAIDEAAENDEECFAVLESMLAGRRISFIWEPRARAA
jgi:hypothetical protein